MRTPEEEQRIKDKADSIIGVVFMLAIMAGLIGLGAWGLGSPSRLALGVGVTAFFMLAFIALLGLGFRE